MRFNITFTRSAKRDLEHFRAYEKKIVLAAVNTQLRLEPGRETRNKKRLRPNELAKWALRIGPFRVFYEIDETEVEVIAVGAKEHNDLFIRGRRVEL